MRVFSLESETCITIGLYFSTQKKKIRKKKKRKTVKFSAAAVTWILKHKNRKNSHTMVDLSCTITSTTIQYHSA